MSTISVNEGVDELAHGAIIRRTPEVYLDNVITTYVTAKVTTINYTLDNIYCSNFTQKNFILTWNIMIIAL